MHKRRYLYRTRSGRLITTTRRPRLTPAVDFETRRREFIERRRRLRQR
jgi:hypothetical protein